MEGSEGFPDDDTIELMLTPEQMQALERASQEPSEPSWIKPAPAAAALPQADLAVAWLPTAPAISNIIETQIPVVRPRRWPLARAAAVLSVTVALAALGSAARRSTIPAAKWPPTVAPAQTQPVAPATDPIRLENPFDRSETFEFPPGTDSEQARQEVAELLLQRARERHIPSVDRRRRGARVVRDTDSFARLGKHRLRRDDG